MNLEAVFTAANMTAMAAWLMLVFFPKWRYTASLVTSVAVPGLLGTLYTFMIVRGFGSSEGGFGSLAQVALLFQNETLLLAGWIHYLAFDLFVGSWQVRDAQRHGINHLLVIPCLFFTFMLGPVGMLMYFALRYFTKKQMLIEVAHA